MCIQQSILQRAEGKLSISEATSINDYLKVQLIYLYFALFPACYSDKEFLDLVILSAFWLAKTDRRDFLATIQLQALSVMLHSFAIFVVFNSISRDT